MGRLHLADRLPREIKWFNIIIVGTSIVVLFLKIKILDFLLIFIMRWCLLGTRIVYEVLVGGYLVYIAFVAHLFVATDNHLLTSNRTLLFFI